MPQVLKDPIARKVFKTAVLRICAGSPTRGALKELGVDLAALAGRARPWGGAHLYTLLHPERWPKYGIHPDLLRAAQQRAGMAAANGRVKTVVLVRPGAVREGAVVLGRSRKCKRRRCRIWFVPATPNGGYCSPECAGMAKRSRRRKRRSAGK